MRRFWITATSLVILQVNGFGQDAASQPQIPQQQPQQATQSAAPGETSGRVTRVRDLLGLEVVSEKGESFGFVDDLTVDRKTGLVEYVLIAPEDNSRNLYPMPWKAVSLYQGQEANDQYLIVGMDPQRLEKAPTVTRDQWPTMTYTQWNTYVPRVATYYGEVRPVTPRAVRRSVRALRRALD